MAGPNGTAQITLSDGRRITIPKERGQVGISGGQIASDGTVGWLAEFSVETVSYPVAETLVIWRAGSILRRFQADQSFWSWAFYSQGKQVAYHDRPLHGELSHTASFMTSQADDGSLSGMEIFSLEATSPAWTAGLTH